MIEHIARYPRIATGPIFVGDPEDVVDERFGPDLPLIRDWTREHYDFAGYVTGFDPAAVADREALRAELGYRPDERVCVVTVGGSGVGEHLLRRVVDAYRRGGPPRAGAADGRRHRPAHRPGVAPGRPTASRCALRARTSTGTSRRATSRSSRAD